MNILVENRHEVYVDIYRKTKNDGKNRDFTFNYANKEREEEDYTISNTNFNINIKSEIVNISSNNCSADNIKVNLKKTISI